MKGIRVFLGSLFVGAVALLFCVGFAAADGMIIPSIGKIVHEIDQKAVVFYDEGVEHLFISISFQGDAEEFAWIVPTPTQPEVGKSTDRLFTRLDELTRSEYPISTRNHELFSGAMEQDSTKSVTVLETKKIEYYDISVLEASNKDALYSWLNDHKYRFPQGGKYIIDEYIQKGWVFTAVKIDNQRFLQTGEYQLKTGHAIPLKLSFKTDQIVYPLKISSITGMEDDAPDGEVTYIDGAVGKGVKLDTDRMISTDEVIEGFDIINGKASFFIKKRGIDPIGSVLKIKRNKDNEVQEEGLTVNNTIGNVYNFILHTGGISHNFSVDLGSDFKKNEWQKFEFRWNVSSDDRRLFVCQFFIDNIERTLNQATRQSRISIGNISDKKATLSVGGERNFFTSVIDEQVYEDEHGFLSNQRKSKHMVTHTSDIMIDEIVIHANDKLIFNADFSDQLKVQLVDEKENQLRIFKKSVYGAGGLQTPTKMGVLLYIFADKKYEISGFDLQFAGPVDKENIENIAKIDGKTPWIEPASKDYYLTRLYKYMDISEMSEDLYPKLSKNQEVFNYVGGEKTRIWLIVGLIVLSTVSVIVIVLFVARSEKKPKKK